ncbi:glycoside hydrolase family 16 protein [Muriicola sp. Z0-33]|uniref:glycoside hydrolase family 16 protein n=1 Tax=Muriicola sp. Z0-33 TaxID=2816957 RepID=UPI0022387FD4|nr:glycoside hydrolase family 16 protein [Muriicola sp. Z0-33]MCW5517877.1 glycoside hydrolase family 16 protein [Muriicola sp. Z0-33]
MTKQKSTLIIVTAGVILTTYLIFCGMISPEVASRDLYESLNTTDFKTLVWSDEFNGEGTIDKEKWFQQTKLPPGGSWWGGLVQHYTNREGNAHLKDGHLKLVAKKEELNDQGETKQYTSARLNSKFAFTYGRVEVRAKLPAGVGTWPAIWMLNKNINEDGAYWEKKGFGEVNWPNCGEMDIMEHWGKNPNYISSAVHNGSSYGYKVKNLGGQNVDSVSSKFHVYSIDWSAEQLIFSVDGVPHFKYQPSDKNRDTWPYDSDYYILLNIAIESDIDPAFVESAMEVDYIRIYQ